MPPKKKTKKTEEEAKSKKEDEKVADDDDSEDAEESSEDESTDDEDRGRGKRKRRESKGFEPEDFTMASERAAVKAAKIRNQGRGVKLGDIPAVKAAIEKVPTTSEDLPFAYTFVFSNRGLPAKKEMKSRLLDFSGYLPPPPKGKTMTQEEIDAGDEKHEVWKHFVSVCLLCSSFSTILRYYFPPIISRQTKYATKAYKLNLAQLRRLCDFFHIDQSHDSTDEDGESSKKAMTKDETVDRLLDFLGEPSESWVKADTDDGKKKKKSTTPKKKESTSKKTKKATSAAASKKRNSVSKKVTEDPFALIKAHVRGDKPTDATLRQFVKAYVVCFDMDKATTKHAIQTASDKFGVDMIGRKKRIKEMLTEELD
jgi:hypothetical protein